jgi:hypothetical protein
MAQDQLDTLRTSCHRYNLLVVPVSSRTGFPVASFASNGFSLTVPRVPVTSCAVSFRFSMGTAARQVRYSKTKTCLAGQEELGLTENTHRPPS